MSILALAQTIISFLLIILILLQQRGTALGSAFGGGGESYGTLRGIQKNMFWGTVILGALFIVFSVFNLLF